MRKDAKRWVLNMNYSHAVHNNEILVVPSNSIGTGSRSQSKKQQYSLLVHRGDFIYYLLRERRPSRCNHRQTINAPSRPSSRVKHPDVYRPRFGGPHDVLAHNQPINQPILILSNCINRLSHFTEIQQDACFVRWRLLVAQFSAFI